MTALRSRNEEANRLHNEGVALSDAGDLDGALAKYREALELDLERPSTLYNVGAIYKQRAEWTESFRFNKLALALGPDDDASAWNLAIAATALRDWSTARAVWGALGITAPPGDGPTDNSFGVAPVRLNPEEDPEVVWARRVYPVLARLTSVPVPESGFRYDDLILHDTTPVGYRTHGGQEHAVFDVLDIFESSEFYSTFEANLTAPEHSDVEALKALCAEAGIACEDWSESTRFICTACSQGRLREHHDAEVRDKAWRAQRTVAFAATWDSQVESVLDAWTRKGRVVRLAGIGNSRGARCWVRRATRDRAVRIVEIGARRCATCDRTLTTPGTLDHRRSLTDRPPGIVVG